MAVVVIFAAMGVCGQAPFPQLRMHVAAGSWVRVSRCPRLGDHWLRLRRWHQRDPMAEVLARVTTAGPGTRVRLVLRSARCPPQRRRARCQHA